MKKVLLIYLWFSVSSHAFTPSKYGSNFKWKKLNHYGSPWILIPKTKVDNLLIKSPQNESYPTDQKIYRFPSFKNFLIEVDSFYISQYEVTNIQYLEFLADIKKAQPEIYQQMIPDEKAWSTKFGFFEPLNEYYLRSPVYKSFPVVGISYEQATEYCLWYTKHRRTVNYELYKNAEYKLPTKAQWLVAALGKNHERRFPWDGTTLQNEKGEWLANFYQIQQVQVKRLPDNEYIDCHNNSRQLENCLNISDDKELKFRNWITMPVRSHYPNDYGLYNMVGNVEELVREKGITKGGSWNDPGYYLQLDVEERYDSIQFPTSEIGFRVVMEIKK